jgi:hypothetical protein
MTMSFFGPKADNRSPSSAASLKSSLWAPGNVGFPGVLMATVSF